MTHQSTQPLALRVVLLISVCSSACGSSVPSVIPELSKPTAARVGWSAAERDEFLNYSNSNKVMTRPAWTLMSDLEMFRHCEHDGLATSRAIADTLVNIRSSVRI